MSGTLFFVLMAMFVVTDALGRKRPIGSERWADAELGLAVVLCIIGPLV